MAFEFFDSLKIEDFGTEDGFIAGAEWADANPPDSRMMIKLEHRCQDLDYDHKIMKEALEYLINNEPVQGDNYHACPYCDMGGSGRSYKGDAHHDDMRETCPVLKATETLSSLKVK